MIPKKGDHQYKFLVDGEWKTDPTQPTTEENGYKNNVINLENFVTYEMEEKQEEVRSREEKEEKYKQVKKPPSYDSFTGEPPILPPYLRQIILNKVSSWFVECKLLAFCQWDSHSFRDSKSCFCQSSVLPFLRERNGHYSLHDAI